MTAHSVSRVFFWLTAVSLFLLPTMPLPGMPDLRPDDVLPLIWLVAVGPFCRFNLTGAATTRFLILFAILAIIPLSIGFGSAEGYAASFADFNQFIRLGKYISIYLLSYVVLSDNQDDVYYLCFLSLPVLALSLAQFIDLFGLNELYVPIVAPTQFQTLVNGYPYPRPVAMAGNPNVLGFLFSITGIASMHFLLKGRALAVLPLLAGICGLVLTMSRSSLVAFLIGLALLLFIFAISRRRRFFIVLATAVVFLPVIALILSYGPIYHAITWRFATLAHASSEASWTVRLQEWQGNLAMFFQHPLIGVRHCCAKLCPIAHLTMNGFC